MIFTKGLDFICNSIQSCGYDAFVVGGYVRNILLCEKDNFDYDVITNAKPDQIAKIFKNESLDLSALPFGCVTVNYEGCSYQITTFRKEGNYEDNRHPGFIEFCDDIHLDLIRRDFTINAIAYNKKLGFIDDFNGFYDMRNRILKTVKCATASFEEDSLRILRALKFASLYSLDIEEQTESAIFEKCHLLKNLSENRIAAEFFATIMGKNANFVLKKYRNVIFNAIPELKIMNDKFISGKNYYEFVVDCACECKTLESKAACLFAPVNRKAPLALLEKESDYKNTVKKYCLNKQFSNVVINYIAIGFLPLGVDAKKRVFQYLSDNFDDFFDMQLSISKICDLYFNTNFAARTKKIVKQLNYAINSGCYKINHLKINGNDLIELNFAQMQIKYVLEKLLDLVISGELKNEKEELLNYAKTSFLKLGT